ncbi:hypothetical protein DA803_01825 [[Mycoplasma] phocae]|uniref:Variable surface lipoprotein n=1 Tax=[Mycoplasma] phocae TaxID=142651 RepID=A0A2Z5IPX9_9BACT|nr:hypothetical protein [[Mycoplasma] phocae]AXE60823.1 hypothetical protein DA803_01825 [[Mycoplasma] phocae]
MKKKIFLSTMILSIIPITTLVAAACDNNDSKTEKPKDITPPANGGENTMKTPGENERKENQAGGEDNKNTDKKEIMSNQPDNSGNTTNQMGEKTENDQVKKEMMGDQPDKGKNQKDQTNGKTDTGKGKNNQKGEQSDTGKEKGKDKTMSKKPNASKDTSKQMGAKPDTSDKMNGKTQNDDKNKQMGDEKDQSDKGNNVNQDKDSSIQKNPSENNQKPESPNKKPKEPKPDKLNEEKDTEIDNSFLNFKNMANNILIIVEENKDTLIKKLNDDKNKLFYNYKYKKFYFAPKRLKNDLVKNMFKMSKNDNKELIKTKIDIPNQTRFVSSNQKENTKPEEELAFKYENEKLTIKYKLAKQNGQNVKDVSEEFTTTIELKNKE